MSSSFVHISVANLTYADLINTVIDFVVMVVTINKFKQLPQYYSPTKTTVFGVRE